MGKTSDDMEVAIAHCTERSAMDAGFSHLDYLLEQGFDWFAMIKAHRRLTGTGIAEAYDAALATEGWRNWCARRCRIDRECQRLALHYAKGHPESRFVAVVDGRVVFFGTMDPHDPGR